MRETGTGQQVAQLHDRYMMMMMIIIIIIILFITLMHGIYNHIPETNHVSRVAAVLYLQSVLHVMLFRP